MKLLHFYSEIYKIKDIELLADERLSVIIFEGSEPSVSNDANWDSYLTLLAS